MKIAAVDVFGYELRYRHGSYVMSGGRSIDSLPSTVVRIRTDEGIEGFGETCPLGPAYLPAFGEGARAALRELAPALLGLDPRNLALVNETMDRALRGHAYAKSAVDVACWDVLGKATAQPVATLLGGLRQDSYPLYVAIPLGPVEAMVEHVRERVAEGIHRFQLKLGADPREDAASRGGGRRGDRRRRDRDRGRQRRLPAPGRGRRGAAARGHAAHVLRAALREPRGVPLRPPADDAADDPRRVDHGRALAASGLVGRAAWRGSTSR